MKATVSAVIQVEIRAKVEVPDEYATLFTRSDYDAVWDNEDALDKLWALDRLAAKVPFEKWEFCLSALNNQYFSQVVAESEMEWHFPKEEKE